MKRIGILGGTFNPIHLGHLAIAQTAQEKLRLDKVIFVPCYLPPHKTIANLPSAKDRFAMVRLAVEENHFFAVSDFEIKRKEKSYTIDTVSHMRKIFPKPAKLFFIIGEDNAEDLRTWKQIKDILKIVTFIVVNRTGHDSDKTDIKHYAIAMPGIDVSSSCVRRRIEQGKSIKYLVQDNVLRYIEKHKLYKHR